MTRIQSLFVLFLLLLLLIVAILGLLSKSGMQNSLSALAVLVMYLGPFWFGEQAYDVVAKFIDRIILPDVKIGWRWHAAYSFALALVAAAIWTMFAEYVMLESGLLVRDWLLFVRQINENPSLLGYPAFAWGFGMIAFVFCLVGYGFEAAMKWWLAKRKTINEQR